MAVNAVTGGNAAATTNSPAIQSAAGNNELNKDTFLKLLVAQIKNQNPLNPADGVQFVSQLAQFSELEQVMSIRQEVEKFRTDSQPNATTLSGGEQYHVGN